MRVLALDFGSARTGVAVSDPGGTLARPLCVVRRAESDSGLERLALIVREHAAVQVLVGLPLTLRGEQGAQASETLRFVAKLRERLDVPVELVDERFTTALAARTPSASAEDARAAAHLLQGWLDGAGRE